MSRYIIVANVPNYKLVMHQPVHMMMNWFVSELQSSGVQTGPIVGGVLGVLIFLILILIIIVVTVVLTMRSHNRQRKEDIHSR